MALFDDFNDEENIVWIEDVSQRDYVREAVAFCTNRKGAIPKNRRHDGKLFGYATLKADARSIYPGRFNRRYWYLRDYDRGESACVEGSPYWDPRRVPCEAAAPSTIKPGVESRRPGGDHVAVDRADRGSDPTISSGPSSILHPKPGDQ